MRIPLEFQTKSSKIFILIIILLNLLLPFLPLTKTLGYEFSVLNGTLLFIIGGLHLIISQRKYFVAIAFHLLHKNKMFISISIIIPFFFGLISSVLNSNCPLKGGIQFYILISIPSLLFGCILGIFCDALSRKYSFYFFSIITLVLILSPLIEFYFNPQIYFYNPVFGYFPGTIYDEDLTVDRILIAYRIFNLSFFILLFYTSRIIFNKNKIQKTIILLIVFLISASFTILKPSLLFASNKSRIEKELNFTVVSNNFRIHLPDSLNIDKINKYNALLHEYYSDQIKIQLKLSFSQIFDSYLFPGKESKRDLLGSGNADIAKPWLNQIYLNYYNYGATLKHEIVHVLAGEFGTTPLKVAANFNPALIEGLAMSIENNYDNYPIHYMAKLAFEAGYKYPIEKLFSGFNFFSQTSSISYIYAGSFLKYLEYKYGIPKIKKLYAENNFQKVYGKDVNELAIDYETYLKNYLISFNKNKARLYFGSVSIFKKYCPRMAASDVKKAWGLYKNKNYTEALNLFKEVYGYSNSYQSLFGVLSSYSAVKKYVTAAEFLSNQIVNFRSSQSYYNLELILGDLYVRTNQSAKAVANYDSLLIQNPHIGFSNEVLIRKSILAEGIDSLKYYLDNNREQKFRKLLSLNTKGIKYFSIPSLIDLSNDNSPDMINFVENLRKKIKVNDYSSSYAALVLSKFALRNLDYETAQYYAVKSLDFKKDEIDDHMFIENLRMVNWFKNNNDEIKITYSK